MNDNMPPRSLADFPNRSREEEFHGLKPTAPEFSNRPPRPADNMRGRPLGPADEFDRARPKESMPQRLTGEFDLRPLPSPPSGNMDNRPPLRENVNRPDIDGPRFNRDVDGPIPPRFNNVPRFEGPHIDSRGPPAGGPPHHNTPFDGPPRDDERFAQRDNATQQRWQDDRMGGRWQDDRIPNKRPNDMNPIDERGPNWENMERDGVNRENRERL